MNTKINIRFNLKMVEYLNEQLAIENSVTERLVTRIHEVSFPNFKQRLEKNLRETMGRKEMIYQLIVSLGGKPTDTKSTLPTLKMPDSHSIRELKDSVESFTNHRRKEAKLAEEEIHKIKADLMIEKAGVIAYKILLRIADQANIPDATSILKQSIEEEESMSNWITDNISVMIDHLWSKIESALIE
jgi:ferritin-like metal-binding protein YciE